MEIERRNKEVTAKVPRDVGIDIGRHECWNSRDTEECQVCQRLGKVVDAPRR
jgi:hypothetical protein